MSNVAIQLHGIYERRNGRFDQCIETWPAQGIAAFNKGRRVDKATGRVSLIPSNGLYDHTDDIIREVVVGKEWWPWNGGTNPVSGQFVDVILRGGKQRSAVMSDHIDWSWTPGDEPSPHVDEDQHIVAWRPSETKGKAASSEDGRAAMQRLANADAERMFCVPKVPAKLRADLGDKISIERTANGGFVVANLSPQTGAYQAILAAVSSGEDLIAWLTAQETTSC